MVVSKAVVVFLFSCCCLGGNSTQIDPKLDFESVENGRTDQKSMKQYGVRVTVDSAQFQDKGSFRNKDSEVFRTMQLGDVKNHKTINVQTDITIDLLDEDSEDKPESRHHVIDEEDDEDDIVPVFKGKSVEPARYKPNRKIFLDSPQEVLPLPVFPMVDDDSFRNLNWFHFQPPSSGLWTTAKPYQSNDNFIPYEIGLKPSNLHVLPCDCKFHNDQHNHHNHPTQGPERRYYNPNDNRRGLPGIDDKLEYPFSA